METGFGEFVALSDQANVPILLRLAERPWGAVASLPASKLKEAGFTGKDWEKGGTGQVGANWHRS